MNFRVKAYLALPSLFLVAACGGGAIPAPRSAGHVPVPPPGMSALTTVIGANAKSLISQFGNPIMDVTEGSARKLQFGSGICVLDAYLYPPKGGRGEAVVTFAETRQRNGAPIDQASCAAAIKGSRNRR